MAISNLIATFIAAPTHAPLAEDVILEDYGQSMVYHGRTAVLPILRAYFSDGFPDGRICVDATFSDSRIIVIAFTFRGRHNGRFLGLPPTGREVAVPMILLCHTTDHHIQHIAWYYDAGTLLRQIGLAL
jgi:steroid delta-isomerase-like uncharacterized protein